MPDENQEITYQTRFCRFCRRDTEHLVEPWDHGMHGGKELPPTEQSP